MHLCNSVNAHYLLWPLLTLGIMAKATVINACTVIIYCAQAESIHRELVRWHLYLVERAFNWSWIIVFEITTLASWTKHQPILIILANGIVYRVYNQENSQSSDNLLALACGVSSLLFKCNLANIWWVLSIVNLRLVWFHSLYHVHHSFVNRDHFEYFPSYLWKGNIIYHKTEYNTYSCDLDTA